ncbi:DUF3050 domain-containing protein [Rufibacter glacialis]|uniref:DUF3050 domain-containing protein n=1 Tax=Rufibacter glacialis TaxID=1259555 RepID=A0A5M8QL06_9BACT|nr:DUF3050 domain-containing protein [Rufibacter glacialis]KAA6435446.1 DUF3050 domain-containing protein [Rufibacter glacialis]GGK63530.1 hypothetical protein GCM10011405_09440 [Rufibacter glacialis]
MPVTLEKTAYLPPLLPFYQEKLNWLQQELRPYRQALMQHPLYESIYDLADLRVFMENHIFAVWDFMSLLKSLQRHLTCVDVPWTPHGNPANRRLINEIVLEEETDVDPAGQPISHFELYIRAMEECGADTRLIHELMVGVQQGKEVLSEMEALPVLANTKSFVSHTFKTIQAGQAHRIAAAFTFGREDVIPDMFRALIGDMNRRYPGTLDTFQYYMDRHIQLDDAVHSPLAMRMVAELCGQDEHKWEECLTEAITCQKLRLHLWDGILANLRRY